MLSKLPVEILLKIYSYLSNADLSAMRLTEKENQDFLDALTLWKDKCINEFPHHLQGFLLSQEINYYDLYREFYAKDYASLTSTQKKLIESVKEGNLQNFIKHYQWQDMFAEDATGKNIIEWIIEKKQQPFLDYIFNQKIEAYKKDQLDYLSTDDIVEWNIFHLAVACNQVDFIKTNLQTESLANFFYKKDKFNNTPISLAISLNLHEMFDAICKMPHFNVNQLDESGRAPLHIAIDYLRTTFLEALLKDEKIDIHQLDAFHQNALHHLASIDISKLNEQGIQKVLKILDDLLVKKVNINQVDNKGYTPLLVAYQKACSHGQLTLIDAFLKKGANPDIMSQKGLNILHYAVCKNQVPIVELLLKYQVNLDLLSRLNKYTALHYAAEKGYSDIVIMLLKKGATLLQNDGYSLPLIPKVKSYLKALKKITEAEKNFSTKPGKLFKPSYEKLFCESQQMSPEIFEVHLYKVLKGQVHYSSEDRRKFLDMNIVKNTQDNQNKVLLQEEHQKVALHPVK